MVGYEFIKDGCAMPKEHCRVWAVTTDVMIDAHVDVYDVYTLTLKETCMNIKIDKDSLRTSRKWR